MDKKAISVLFIFIINSKYFIDNYIYIEFACSIIKQTILEAEPSGELFELIKKQLL